ncbi:EAL domain-containing protein [Sulfurimonas sp.]|uniref:bifunctional diguanylate cyclase/phosphodiesterase n=1 Tax=Sulfurimonas sp. TaxID=2022749 RepID=UPI003567800E
MKEISLELKLQLIIVLVIISATALIMTQSINGIKSLSQENIQRYSKESYEDQKRELKNYVYVVMQTVEQFYKASVSKNENKTQKEQKKIELQTKEKLLQSLSQIRLGENGYIWVNDISKNMLMHPIFPNLNGKNLSNLKDNNGIYIFDEMVKTVNANGEGFIKYSWPKPSSKVSLPKISFVKIFEPWGWIVGSGEYIDYIENHIEKMRKQEKEAISKTIVNLAIISLGIAVILILSTSFIIKKAIIIPLEEREQMQEELIVKEEMFRTLAENSPNIIMRYNHECKRIYANQAFMEQTGIPEDEVTNNKPEKQWGIYLDMLNMSAQEYQQRVMRVINSGENDSFSVEWIVFENGKYVAHDLHIVAERDSHGEIIGALAIGHNVTERKNIERRVEFMAHHDALTGLPNRILVKDRTEQVLEYSKRQNKKAAFMFIDLDEFKNVNDSLGHTTGDAMLKVVSSRLENSIRARDTLGRQGGDEFLLVLSDIKERKDIAKVANKLINEFKIPFVVNNHTISMSASIGIAVYPEDGENFEELLQSSDSAMYKAKEIGKNNYCFFTQEMKHSLIGMLQVQNDLKNAIKKEEFILYYQPQIDIVNNKINGVEALLRWNHPKHGIMSPMSFISIAESSGLIIEIGEWVLKEACRQAALWNSDGKEIIVAVNISAVQLRRGNFKELVKRSLDESGLNPRCLELELTESILINDTENILLNIKDIKELGVQLSIDDFGTGYSSLSYLKRFSVDKLKIDQSFIKDILRDKEYESIVKTIIQMAKSFNLRSIAEGVESEKVLELVREFGCDEVQGYYFAEPMSIEDFEDYYMERFSS